MRVGKIKNIDIKLNISSLLIILLIGFYAASLYESIVGVEVPFLELFLVGLLNGIILMVSIFLHELMHSIVAQHYGLEVKEIELHLFGGVSRIKEEPRTPKSEFAISGVGPLTSLILGFGSILFLYVPLALPSMIRFTLFYTGISNILLALFNLIPAFPMDGGRVLRSILWQRRKNLLSATQTASKVGVVFGYLFIAYGLFQMFLFGVLSGVWLLLIGTFVISSAKNALTHTLYEVQLSHIDAKDIIRIPKVFIPFNISVEEALNNYFRIYKYPYFPVVQGSLIVGLIHLDDIKKIPLDLRHRYMIGYTMRKISEFPQIHTDKNGKEVLHILNDMGKIPHIVVVEDEDNKLLGFIGTEDLVAALKYFKLISPTS